MMFTIKENIRPHCCPVCFGTGNVPGGFYNHIPGCASISNVSIEACRSCKNGIIWGPSNVCESEDKKQ